MRRLLPILPLLALLGCPPPPEPLDVWLEPPGDDAAEDHRPLEAGPGEFDPPLDDDDVASDDDDSAPGVCDDDHFEQNDTPDKAWPLEPGLYPFLVLCDADHFLIDLQEGDTLYVDLGWDGSEGLLGAGFLDPSGQPPGDAPRLEGQTLELVADSSGGWTLSVELLEDAGDVPGAAYSLALEVVPLECDPGAFEPNDSDLAPWPMEPGSFDDLNLCPFEDDFFAVWLEPGEALLATVAFEPDEGDLDLSLFNPSLALLDTSDGVGAWEEVAATATSAGWHVLWAELVTDSGPPGLSYALEIDLL